MSKYLVTYESPSNIAIVKYWGKKDRQIPLNPSMSFTLSESKTITKIEYTASDEFKLDFYFEDQQNEKFKLKLQKKLLELVDIFPWLKTAHLIINSHNTFPHSAGIASSASSMSALALGLVDIDFHLKLKVPDINDSSFIQLSSLVARILSGSASRSIFKTAAVWGHTKIESFGNDQFAIGIDELIHPKFKTLNDAILIVDSNEKSVSSSAGHELMNQHVHRESRINHANRNFIKLIDVLKSGDFESFCEISEIEALDLHAMMMTSKPSFILLRPESLMIIDEIRKLRARTNFEVTFTIDAGPNIHVLYTDKNKIEIENFLNELVNTKKTASRIIYDRVGAGAKKIS